MKEIARWTTSLILLTLLSASFLFFIVPWTAAQQIFSDPLGDTFNEYGRSVSTDNYVDIIGAELYRAGTTIIARIIVNGPLPKDIETDASLRWELLMDTDRYPGTKFSLWTPWPLIDNGIGVDAEAKVEIHSERTYTGDIYPSGPMYWRINRTIVEMRFDSSVVGNPSAFDFVIAVTKYVGNHMVGADKIPNVGRFTYSNGAVTAIPEFNDSLQIIMALVTVTASAVAVKSRSNFRTRFLQVR
jgi:hypothetical protein